MDKVMDMETMRALPREKLIEMFREMGKNMPRVPDPLTREVKGERIMLPTRDGEVRCLVYKPKRTPAPVYFAIHGGGFVMGNAEDIDFFCNDLRNELDILVININYRKAPDSPFPAAVNDVFDVVSHVVANAEKFGADISKMGIGGHSAGGNLSAVTVLKAKLENAPFSFKVQVLDYPPVDLATHAFDKMKHDKAIPPQMALMFDACYFKDGEETNIYLSPVCATHGQLEGICPAVVLTAEYDSLRPEGERYAKMLIDAGVPVTMRRFPAAVHGFTMMPTEPLAAEGRKFMVDALRYYLA